MDCTVDIICPVYNGEDCILELDKSIKKQKNVKINSIKYAVTESKDDTEKTLQDNDIDYIKIKKENRQHRFSDRVHRPQIYLTVYVSFSSMFLYQAVRRSSTEQTAQKRTALS